MPHKKRRQFQHIMEDQSMAVLHSQLPKEWVIRTYKPDYGIDIVVEIFEYLDASEKSAETLGEVFFAQVKSVESLEISKLNVNPRYNVEKGPLKTDTSKSEQIDVIRFRIDTDELLTVQAMGAGLPVLLLLVAIDTNRTFFLCLNDYIEKVLIPNEQTFATVETKTVYIPLGNEIKNDNEHLGPLRFYAKRSKLYAAFSKFTYQEHELGYLMRGLRIHLDNFQYAAEVETIRHFIDVVMRYDFWGTTPMWYAIQYTYSYLRESKRLVDRYIEVGAITRDDLLNYPTQTSFSEDDLVPFLFTAQITTTWGQLKNLNSMYEEICREWFLPTFLGQVTSGCEDGTSNHTS